MNDSWNRKYDWYYRYEVRREEPEKPKPARKPKPAPRPQEDYIDRVARAILDQVPDDGKPL